MAHARFAPSSAQRIIDCPASLRLNETEKDRAGIDAAHGTAAHHLGELCNRSGKRVSRYAGCTLGVMTSGEVYFVTEVTPAPAEGEGWAFEVDDEMVECVQEYVDWCREVPGDHHVEVRVDISHWCPEEGQFGTSDHTAVDLPGKQMYVTDLKYGKGVQVFAEKNPQAILYALGALWMFDAFEEVETIHIRICQPRLKHKDVWTVSRKDLLDWGDHIRERFELALTENPPFGPTPKACKFCKVAARCRALHESLNKERALAFDDISGQFEEQDVAMLSDEELVAAWRKSSMLAVRSSAVEKEIMRLLLNKVELPGVRLGESTTHRRFKNSKEAEVFLLLDCDLNADQIFTRKLTSPAQALKLVPKGELRKELADMVEKPRGGPRIVESGSKIPQYEGSAGADVSDAFEDLDES